MAIRKLSTLLLWSLLCAPTWAAGDITFRDPAMTGTECYVLLESGPGEADKGEYWDGDSWEPLTSQALSTFAIYMEEEGSMTIGSATGTSPIVVTTTTSHGRTTGDVVNITGADAELNGHWTITVVDGDEFSLDDSTGDGTYDAGGTVTWTGRFHLDMPAIGDKSIKWQIVQDASGDQTPDAVADIALYEGSGEWYTTKFGSDARAWAGVATDPTDIALLSFTALMASSVGVGNAAGTLGEALEAARAQGFGKWSLNASTRVMTLYAPDGTTEVASFLIGPNLTAPLTRTPQ